MNENVKKFISIAGLSVLLVACSGEEIESVAVQVANSNTQNVAETVTLDNVPRETFTQNIEIELIEENEEGFIFLDHGAEFEPRIFVDHVAVENCDLVIGEKYIGVFDSDGWEMYGLEGCGQWTY